MNNTINKTGILITFEGIDGSGKTTILNKIKENKRIKLLNPIYTKEPNSNYNTYKILNSFLNTNYNDPITELFLFMENHIEHLKKVIYPSIKSNKIIFCDRYIDSRCAYQGVTLDGVIENPVEFIMSIHNKYSIKPNMTFYIDIDPSTCIKRCMKREKLTKYENLNFLSCVNENFNKIIKSDPSRFIILDGTKNITELENEVIKSIFKNI